MSRLRTWLAVKLEPRLWNENKVWHGMTLREQAAFEAGRESK